MTLLDHPQGWRVKVTENRPLHLVKDYVVSEAAFEGRSGGSIENSTTQRA